jgi:hypothetical protein
MKRRQAKKVVLRASCGWHRYRYRYRSSTIVSAMKAVWRCTWSRRLHRAAQDVAVMAITNRKKAREMIVDLYLRGRFAGDSK